VTRIDELLEQYKNEYPEIDPFQDDWDWRFQARLSIQMGRLDAAEALLKQLILSRPVHHEGYEGLARVYLEQGNPDAVPLIRRAYELAKAFVDKGALEPKALAEIEKKMAEIEDKFGQSQ
jgi:DNA-binding SARP family transcriptional activator